MILSKLTSKAILELARRPGYYNSSTLTREIGATYSHITKFLKIIEEEEIIKRESKDKRQKMISLIDKGYKVNDLIIELKNLGVEFR